MFNELLELTGDTILFIALILFWGAISFTVAFVITVALNKIKEILHKDK